MVSETYVCPCVHLFINHIISPYCKRAKQLIAKYSNSIKIIEVDLEENSRDIQLALHSISGQYTFPNLFIHGQSFGGFDNLSELDRQGKLSKLFLEQ